MQRENNFDLIRLCLAWMVVVVHVCVLCQSTKLLPIAYLLSSRVAIEGFFAISGCLIVASWDRTKTTSSYFRRRAQRILPAYWLALVYTLILGTIMTTLPVGVFWRSPVTWKYVICNLLFVNFLQPGLPGVFANNVLPAMNGALWTIKVEISFYLAVPLIVWLCRRCGVAWTLGSIFVLSSIFRMWMDAKGHQSLAVQLPGQLAYFALGAGIYFYYPWFLVHRNSMWLLAITCAVAGCFWGVFPLRAIGIPLCVMCIGFLLPTYRGVTRYGDFSYGTYVLHFPTIQLLISLGLFSLAPYWALLIAATSVSLIAVFSWFEVESRFLRRARVRPQVTAAITG